MSGRVRGIKRSAGDPPFSREIRAQVPVSIHMQLLEAATELSISLSDLMRLIVRQWLRERLETKT